jgi:hypothetical protein
VEMRTSSRRTAWCFWWSFFPPVRLLTQRDILFVGWFGLKFAGAKTFKENRVVYVTCVAYLYMENTNILDIPHYALCPKLEYPSSAL